MTEEKLREVYDKYYRLVMKAAYDVLKDFDDSQDVCREVFHKLIQKWNKVSPEDYAGWLALTARRKALDFLKKSYRKHEMTVLEQPCENGKGEHAERLIYHREATTGEDLLDAIIKREFTTEFMDRLYARNPQWHEIMTMQVYEQATDAEMAAALGLTIENLRVKKHRMNKWIEKTYGDKYDDI